MVMEISGTLPTWDFQHVQGVTGEYYGGELYRPAANGMRHESFRVYRKGAMRGY